jgi:hypothetical protein
MAEKKIDFSAAYQVKGWRGIAFRLRGWKQVWEPFMICIDDEDGEEVEMPSPCGEGEWIDDPDRQTVIAVMVGDDRKHEVDIDDLIPLDDLDYCAECGQVGCCHDGRDRSGE